jgi:preprotein translocase subunit SecB
MNTSPLQLDRHFFTKIHLDAHPHADAAAKPRLQAEVDVAPAENEPRRYQLTLRLKVVPPPDKKLPYTAEIHVVGLVRVAPSWPEETLHQLVEVNGTALLYGAAREMLCNLTARGPWPMLSLHSVSFVPPAKPPAPTPPPARPAAPKP